MVLDRGLAWIGQEPLNLGGKQSQPLLLFHQGELFFQQHLQMLLLLTLVAGDGVVARLYRGGNGKKLFEFDFDIEVIKELQSPEPVFL